jgi:hypothetical protein
VDRDLVGVPMIKYQAYELVDLTGRTILNAPAPGMEVCLVSDLAELINSVEIESEFSPHWQRGFEMFRTRLFAKLREVP